MQPAQTPEELPRRDLHLTTDQHVEMEQRYRGRIHNRMFALPVDEIQQLHHPEYPQDSLMDQGLQLVRTKYFGLNVVIDLRRLSDQARGSEEQLLIRRLTSR